ncbi:MAG TPA: class I SAM-dependent methyltransferase, partial [Actinomycetota bacterium]|nr:class I SAM-dependent methyltransferase [Actinomycetota bacterium]
MARRRTLGIALGTTAAAAVAVRHIRRGHAGRQVAGGILVGDAAAYDRFVHRHLLGSLFRGIAADVATALPLGGRVLEVGCGPGRLSLLLARRYGLDVIGLDLDSAMIARARGNAARAGDGRRPSFVVGDVASLGFPDGSFDLVLSTLSMHHWADPGAGLAEIGRVLQPGGRALIWDLRPGIVPFHAHVPDPAEVVGGSALRLVRSEPWRWPWRL